MNYNNTDTINLFYNQHIYKLWNQIKYETTHSML